MKVPSLDYPLYVVQTGGKNNYFAVQGKNSNDGSPAAAIAIWSYRALAERYLADARLAGTLESLATPHELRNLLVGMKGDALGVGLDPLVGVDGLIHLRWFGDLTAVLDTLPEGFYWDCPLFVIHLGDGNYGASYGVAEGRGKLLAVPVFTDQDLAERFMESTGMVGEIQTLDDHRAVVEFVRLQKVAVVAFDLWKTPAGQITSKQSLEAAEILARLG